MHWDAVKKAALIEMLAQLRLPSTDRAILRAGVVEKCFQVPGSRSPFGLSLGSRSADRSAAVRELVAAAPKQASLRTNPCRRKTHHHGRVDDVFASSAGDGKTGLPQIQRQPGMLLTGLAGSSSLLAPQSMRLTATFIGLVFTTLATAALYWSPIARLMPS